jgi:hypothetical protein
MYLDQLGCDACHIPAFVSATATGLCTFAAMFCIMIATFIATLLTDISAYTAKHFRLAAAQTH